ncbi:hypothetical protein ACFSX5_10660 [Devosia albogilva]|uniref:DUF927 domain-containing protein n=1 Tax=Devosia albogilva TaxID=429726 RepID=A0ABW5QL14_9HYPH
MKFSLSEFLAVFWGASFDGQLKVWSKQTKATASYGPKDISRLVQDVERRRQAEDLYIGLSTQPAGLGATSRGTSDTAMMVPGAFADIDFAEAKNSAKRYPPDAVTALGLLQSFDFAPFLVQNSGNGLHVLFKFDKPLLIENRHDRLRAQNLLRVLSRKLAKHFESAGYEIDNVSDLARVLRVPETFNHKSGAPKRVAVIEYNPQNHIAVTELEQELFKPTDDKRGTPVFPRGDHTLVQQECPWYRYYTGEGAANADEPTWHATASVTARCRDGERIFHEYSARHAAYNPGEANRKLQRALDEAGPRTCATISELGGERFCADCPHRGTITSPIQLGRGYDPGLSGPKRLGFTKEGHYALLDPVRKIVVLATAQQLLAEQYLLGLAETAFWATRYPGRKPGSTNFRAAGEALIKACRRAGAFNPVRIRGRGVWLEDGVVVVNLGQPVNSAKYLYLCFESISLDSGTQFDVQRLRDHLDLYRWRNPLDAALLFGWLAMAPVCGALSWRPHAFVYGPARSGKTTIHTVASIILSPLAISADGQSTEAGIRQTLGPDSLPVLLDEFESDQNGYTLKNILRLARSASSADTPVLRGTPEGKAMSFSLRTTFLFSAINPRGMSPADQSRISMFELQMHDNDREKSRRIASDEAYFRATGSAWASHMIKLAHLVQPSADAIDLHLTGDRRHRQNMSILLGAGFVALHERTPTNEEAEELATAYASTIERHALEGYRDDAQECFDHLLSHVVDGLPLGHWLARLREGQAGRLNDVLDAERVVSPLGIRVILGGEHEGVYIANGAPGLEEVFHGTSWAQRAWQTALRKLDGSFTPPNPVQFRLLGKKRALGIPIFYLPEEAPASWRGPVY